MGKSYINLKKINDKKGEIEFEAEVSSKTLEENSARLLAELSAGLELPGFRKGSVPNHIAKQHIDESRLFEDAASSALRESIREIATDENLAVIGMPEITVIKLALNNPVAFKVKFALMPEVNLPDYKKIGREIAQRENKIEATDEEVEESIKRLQKMMSPKAEEGKEAAVVEINDEFVKQFGPFKNVADFKEELKKQIAAEKGFNMKQTSRDEIIKEISEKSKVIIPEMLIDQEMKNLALRRNEELFKAGITYENYLKEIKKTEEELQKEEQSLLEKQIKAQFVISEIQRKEKFEADEDEIHAAEAQLKMRYPEKDHSYLHRMSEALILQEKLFALFEEKPKAEEKKDKEEKKKDSE